MALSWHEDKEDKYAVSTCGKFSVTVGGPMYADGKRLWGFLAWAKSVSDGPEFGPWGVIGFFVKFEDAKRACSQHSRNIYRGVA